MSLKTARNNVKITAIDEAPQFRHDTTGASAVSEGNLKEVIAETNTPRLWRQESPALALKIAGVGLVDIGLGKSERGRWFTDVSEVINCTRENGEIFVVGRTNVLWCHAFQTLTTAVVDRGIQCTFVIADPTLRLDSIVTNDPAVNHLAGCWADYQQMAQDITKRAKPETGWLAVYGIPGYVPVGFARHDHVNGAKYCMLEVGIATPPESRPFLVFRALGGSDMYNGIDAVYKRLLEARRPLLFVDPNGKSSNRRND